MTKISETGHAKNVENFRRLYDHLMNFGGKYAPSDARLQLANVATVLQAASSSLTALSVANPPFLQAVSRREAAFACSQMGEAAARQVKMDKAHFTVRRTFAARSAFTCSQMGEAAARQVKMDKAHFTVRRTFAARSAFTCSQMGEAAARQVKMDKNG